MGFQKNSKEQMAPRVTADDGQKGVVKPPPKEFAGERSCSRLVGYEASDKDCYPNKTTAQARIAKGAVMEVGSTTEMAVMGPSRNVFEGRVLENEKDIAKTVPLLQIPDLNGSSDSAEQRGQTLTHLDASQSQTTRNEMAIQLLLRNNFDIKQKDFDKNKALLWAAKSWHEGVVQLLLEKGAIIDAEAWEDGTSLRHAALSGNVAVA